MAQNSASKNSESTGKRFGTVNRNDIWVRLVYLVAIGVALSSRPAIAATADAEAVITEVMVYGATPAGIAAALAAAKDDCRVILIEPTARIGGLVTSGLSHTDYHSRESLSGAFLEFSQAVNRFYETKYGVDSPQAKTSEQGVFAEPSVNLSVFESLLSAQPQIRVVRNFYLESTQVVEGEPYASIASVKLIGPDASSLVVTSRVVIDASYEGDLMAAAGQPYRVGREGKDEYSETLAPEQGDDQLQAYNFRLIMTKDSKNRVMPQAPIGYRREDFIGVLDALGSGKIDRVFGYPSRCIFKAHLPPLPNDKYDINDVSNSLVRLSLPGVNLNWPDGTRYQRRTVFDAHLRDQVGLLYFLQNDEAVPEKFRNEAKEWGWCRDEFEESQHLPPQLYVREARRMLGKHIYNQRDAEHVPGDARATLHPSSIAMGDYGNNCHGTFHEGPRFGGKHSGEFYNPVPPYQIPYGVLLPRTIGNLLVPGAVSSSHVGFCALRYEPIWMSLGQASGHAAAMAVHDQVENKNIVVHELALRRLQHRLRTQGAALIYVGDVLPGHADFVATQWWAGLGGLHGLEPMPATPGQRGKKLHGQYYAANPGHEAQLNKTLDAKTYQRWRVLATMQGLAESTVPEHRKTLTRGDFIRRVYSVADSQGIVTSQASLPRVHRDAVANSHPPGEVDDPKLALKIVSDATTLPGIVVDDCDAVLVGKWQLSTHTPPYVGAGYLHDMYNDKGAKSARFQPNLPLDGQYEVRLAHCSNVRRTTNALVIIQHADGVTKLRINQQEPAEHGALFKSLGRFRFSQEQPAWVEISNAGTEGKVVIADAIQFLPLGAN